MGLKITIYVLLVELLMVSAEWYFSRKNYNLNETFNSLVVFVLSVTLNIGYFLLYQPIYLWFYKYRLIDFRIDHIWSAPLLIIVFDFFYYWMHRFMHHVALGWATHTTHHAPRFFNFSTSFCVGVTKIFSLYWIFHIPLIFLGLPPLLATESLFIIDTYQFWIHTNTIPKLPVLDWILNTPSHHRVHHRMGPGLVTKNYGGIFIIFDRIFGTFQAEEPMEYQYGWAKENSNAFDLIFEGWRDLFLNVAKEKNVFKKLAVIFSVQLQPLSVKDPYGADDLPKNEVVPEKRWLEPAAQEQSLF